MDGGHAITVAEVGAASVQTCEDPKNRAINGRLLMLGEFGEPGRHPDTTKDFNAVFRQDVQDLQDA